MCASQHNYFSLVLIYFSFFCSLSLFFCLSLLLLWLHFIRDLEIEEEEQQQQTAIVK